MVVRWAGGVCLAALHFATPYASAAMGVLAIVLLVLGLFDVRTGTFPDQSMVNGIACGLLLGLSVGYIVRKARGRR
jgi:prepilin signal peptidase PulO-like enzyme (type II secretory pathway)